MLKRIFYILSLCLALVACSGSQAPQQTFQKLDGTTFTLADLKGKVVYVEFWATSCTTCMKIMPQTIADYEKYRDQGYEVVAVAMSYDPIEFVKNYTTEKALPFTVVHDKSGELAKAFDQVKFTPIGFLVNRKGEVVKRFVGDFNHAEFIKTLEKTLSE